MKGLLFTYGLTYGGAVTSLFNPFNGVLIYFAFAIISPASMWFWSVPAGRYSFTVAVALLIGWALKGFGRWNFGAAGIIVWSFIGFYLWGVISGRLSEFPARSHGWTIQQAKILLPFLAAVTLVDSLQKVKQIAWVLMLSQAYVAYELNLSYWAGFNRVYEIGHAGMDNNCNAIAAVAGAGLAFFLGIRQKNIYLKCLCFYCAGLMAHIPMIAMSRGGMLGLCITGLVSFFILPRKPIHYLFFAMAIVLGMRLAGPAVMQRFSSAFVDEGERDKSAQR